MKRGCVYFNERSGYLIVPEMRAKDVPVWVSANPIEKVDIDRDMSEIGNAVRRALNTSEKNEAPKLSVAKSNHFWNEYGYKSFGGFSKKHSAVQVEDNGEILRLTKLIRDKQGAYVRSQIDNDIIELDLYADSKVICTAIKKLLGGETLTREDNTKTFVTLGRATVTYNFINDDLEDCGDGGTDAYQIYKDLGSNDYIAFLIDNGYQSYAEDDIRSVLERQFGIFDSFAFDDSTPKQICIKAANEKCRIESSLFYNSDDSFELMCYEEQSDSKVTEAYNKIRDSVRVEWNVKL